MVEIRQQEAVLNQIDVKLAELTSYLIAARDSAPADALAHAA